jgi:hypothetical protein
MPGTDRKKTRILKALQTLLDSSLVYVDYDGSWKLGTRGQPVDIDHALIRSKLRWPDS